MARRSSDADREGPRVVPPEPWSESDEETAPGPTSDEQDDETVEEAFDWARVQDEESFPSPPPTSEEAPAAPGETPSDEPAAPSVEAPDWSGEESDVPDQPDFEASEPPEEPTDVSEEVEEDEAGMGVGRRRPLLSPEELAEVTPAELASARELAVLPFGDTNEVEPIDVTIDEPLREEIAARVTRKELKELNLEVSELYRAVEEQISSSKHLSREAIQKLNEARTILLSQPGLFPVAELRVEEARVLLRRAENSERDADRYQLPIFLYNSLWLIVLLSLAVFDRGLALGLNARGITPPFDVPLTINGRTIQLTMAMYFAPWFCMIWGGIGGAIGSLYTLRTYIADREFDREYVVHYYAHAPMGAALGAVVYFLFVGGFFVVGAVTQTSDFTNPAQQVLTATSPLLILIALSFGLVQQAVYQMIDRVVRTVMGDEQSEEDEEAEPARPAPQPQRPANNDAD